MLDLTENLIRSLAAMLFEDRIVSYQGRNLRSVKPFRATQRARVRWEQFNPDLDRDKLRDKNYLQSICKDLGIDIKDSFGSGKLLIEIFEKTVEDELMKPTFITGYPAETSPLARRADDDPWLTDRFELFIAGRELANGFSEFNDPEDQAERFKEPRPRRKTPATTRRCSTMTITSPRSNTACRRRQV